MKFKNNYKLEIIICVIGFLFIIYPFVSNYINLKNKSRVIDKNEEIINNNDNSEIIKEINKYNESLISRENAFKLDKEQEENYDLLLNIDGNGYMGYITIDKINVKLPIYHGTDEVTLSKNVGHLEWSSIPIGGKGTHAVLSAHTGQANNRLFSDLKKLEIDDLFSMHVLGQELIYEVEEVKTINPDDNSELYIDINKDLVTLITCTPYGINTNRLLVRGHRIIENIEYNESVNVHSENKYIGVVFILNILVILITIVIIKHYKSMNKI